MDSNYERIILTDDLYLRLKVGTQEYHKQFKGKGQY